MQTKRCSRCKEYKPLDQFNKNRAMKDGYQNQCRACHNQAIKKSDDSHREQRRNSSLAWYYAHRDEQKEKHNSRSRERWHNDPVYRTRKNKQKLDIYYNNPIIREKKLKQAANHSRLRRAIKLGSKSSYTEQQWLDLCDKFGNRCLCCGKETALTRDHVVPLTRGGSNDISNIQPLCASCNHKKHTKTIDYRR